MNTQNQKEPKISRTVLPITDSINTPEKIAESVSVSREISQVQRATHNEFLSTSFWVTKEKFKNQNMNKTLTDRQFQQFQTLIMKNNSPNPIANKESLNPVKKKNTDQLERHRRYKNNSVLVPILGASKGFH